VPDHSIDLKRRLVDAYRSGRTTTYAATAAMFGVGIATVNRLLRRYRESGDVQQKPRGGNNPRRIDLDWLRAHAEANPDARLIDRMAAWKAHSGRAISLGAMWDAMRVIGWTHKKRLPSRASASTPRSRRAAKASPRGKRSSTSRA